MAYFQNGQPYYGNSSQRQSQQQSQYQQPAYNQRPTSYYVGDDSYGDNDGSVTSPSLERHTSVAQRQNHELFIGDVASSAGSPPPLASPTAPGYGRQYASQSASQSGIPNYNPQQYAAPVALPNPASYGGVNRTAYNVSSPPQPYNPADYADSNLSRTGTVTQSNYGFSPTNSYTSSVHTTPSQQTYPSPPIQQQPYLPPAGTYSSQDNRYGSQPSYGQQAPYQSQSRPSAYTPPAPPPLPVPPGSGSTPGEDWGSLPIRQPSSHSTHSYHRSSDAASYNHPLPSPPVPSSASTRSHGSRHGSQRDVHSPPGYHISSPLPPTPPAPPHGSPQRRNTVGRPLPPPPQESDTEDSYPRRNGGGYFNQNQDELFDEIENTIMGVGGRTTASPRIVEPLNGDRPYQAGLDRSGSGRTTGVTNGHLSPGMHIPDTYNYSDESDVEAAAGVAALQAAEAQEQAEEARRRSGGSGLFSNYSSLQPPASYASGGAADRGSDSDYVGVDMTSFAPTYDPHFSYGGKPEELAAGGTAAPAGGNQSQPVSSSGSLRRSEASEADSYDYGMDNIHPFPPFSAGARVDTFGTGGLAEPTALRRRLSYDEGDEDNFDSVAPAAGEPPDMFYHPGMSNRRPLPPPPPLETRYQNDWRYSNNQSPSYTPEGYHSSTPGGTLVPRSTSMLSHSHTPQTQPPTRSKTDAEQTARLRQPGRPATFYGNDTVTPPSEAVPLDLPAIPTGKRFNPSKLTDRDFNRCTEPWALSSVIAWLKYMAEGETDLKENLITEGLVALFTHKVPTMNIADAETISERVVQDMYKAGTLVHDEEWLKFSSETMTGVIFQLTGAGCYSPKLHDHETAGRCYSHLCQRTVKKIDLAAQPSLEQKDWVTTYNITKEQLEGVDKHEIERQNILHEILTGEEKYMADLDVLRILYRDRLIHAQPAVIPPKKLRGFIEKVFGAVDAVKKANEGNLLAQLKYRQREQGPWIHGFSDIFREWIRKAKQAYLDYCTQFPHAESSMRQEESRNMIFRAFLEQARADKRSNKLNWDSFLKAPIARLQRYILLLQTVLKHSKAENEEKKNLQIAIDEIVAVTQECNTRLGQVQHKVEISELQNKLILRPGIQTVELNLDHLGRELIHRGDVLRLGGNRFTWLETHALLFDHYLVLAKTISHRDTEGSLKSEKYDINKSPIPMQLLVLESVDDDPVTKSSVKGITTVTQVTPKSTTPSSQLGRTISNQSPIPGALTHTNTSSSISTTSSGKTMVTGTNLETGKDEKIMYPFRIKHLGKEIYTLFAPSITARTEWCQKIVEAKTKHAASLFAQNAEPFRLRVMADSAFAYESSLGAQKSMVIKGTPLDRAIDDVERLYQHQGRPTPICRARVNCATAFMQPYGKNMVAVGTDNAVYIAEVDNPRGWSRAIQVPRVTQVAVLEEFSLFLLISDKQLIAYHLDAVCPVGGIQASNDSVRRAPQKLSGARDVGFFATGKMKDRTLVFYKKREGISSTFKVLEPVFQKSTEKKSRLFKSGRTEFFREFDEFYIPTECYGINLFHSSLAISTSKGFEVLTLDKKQPWSVPDLKAPHVATIAARLQNQQPLGMFRLSDLEFLLVYNECAVYVNKHGDISRSVIMEFVGRARSAALYNKYLILFDNDFVEVRNALNGRLRQVISGRDVRCLDDGLGGGTEGYRSVKVAMGHPERIGTQVVVEMILNEGMTE